MIYEKCQCSASDIWRQPARAGTDGQCGLNGCGFEAPKASAKCQGSCDGGADRRRHSDGFKREPKGHSAASFGLHPLCNDKGGKPIAIIFISQ